MWWKASSVWLIIAEYVSMPAS
jgi:hypothetical protein